MRILIPALLALVSACQTPLAPTNRPIQEAPALVGDWTMVLEGLGDDEEIWPLRFELIEPEDENSFLWQLGLRSAPSKTRYRAAAQFPSGEGETLDMTFDCQVVEASGRRYLTFQRALKESEMPFIYLFEVPLQNTLRMELEGDELRLLMHEKRYLWVPMAFSGRLEIGKEEESPGIFGALVPTLDAALDAYEDTREEDWTVLCRGKRADR